MTFWFKHLSRNASLSVLCLLLSALSFKLNAQVNESSKPWVLWYWVQAGVFKAGITADLEAMKANGIGGAYLVCVKGPGEKPIFEKPVVQLTPEWWAMVKFAMEEAKRLDLKLGMHVSDGFALAGGPWITPELSMQKVVSSKLNVKGGMTTIQLPQPTTNEGFYKDIAVYAYPSPIGSGSSTQTIKPKVTTSTGADASRLIDPSNKANFSSNDPLWIQYAFDQPFTCRSINIKTSGNNYQAQRLGVEVSNDGKIFRKVVQLQAPRHGWQDTDEDFTFTIVPTTGKYYRFIYNKAASEPGGEDLDAAKWKPALKILSLELSSEAQINQYQGKNGSVWRVSKRTSAAEVPSNLCLPVSKLINLTDKLGPDGKLNWTAPKGNWTILRIGHTSTGHKNATAGGGMGLESDKFNPKAVKLQFDKWYGEALKVGGPDIAAKVMTMFYIDSWECGSQNWSSNFKAEFLKRRGYDLTPYLPIMTGLPINDIQTSENFLYDVRKTISELVVDKFYVTLAELAKEKGVKFTAESVSPTMLSDGMLHYKTVDVPMSEFWLNSPTHDKPNDIYDAISGGHIYGKNIIQAEAFTTVRMDWNEHPGNMKTLLDRNYALGINKIVYHVFTHNPWTDRKPGMTLDGVGLYFQRDQTWWKQGKAWIDYATRCQDLLQQGYPVIDLAVFTGEELPRRSVLPDRLVKTLPGIFGEDVVTAEKVRLANVGEPQRQIPAGVTHSANMADPQNWVNPLRGYAYDSFNPDALENATVENGEVVFASGAKYKIIVFTGKLTLNPNFEYVSYQSLRKLLELIKAGAKVIIADKPIYQNGIKQVSKATFESVVAQIWDGKFQRVQMSHQKEVWVKELGLGKIYRAPFNAENFKIAGLSPDIQFLASNEKIVKGITYAHRKSVDKDIYFVANQNDERQELSASFRVSGKIPMFYDPTTGAKTIVNKWLIHDNRTLIQVALEPHQSLFVIFETPTTQKSNDQGTNIVKYKTIQDLSTHWTVKFDAASRGPLAAIEFKTLTDWTKNADTLINYYSGTAVYQKTFTFSGNITGPVWIDLGSFSAIASVKINGIDCGTSWTAPFQLEISKAIKQGTNTLEITVTNTWGNRLIGDSKLPEKERFTNTTAPFRLVGKPLYESGLFGPITLKIEEK